MWGRTLLCRTHACARRAIFRQNSQVCFSFPITLLVELYYLQNHFHIVQRTCGMDMLTQTSQETGPDVRDQSITAGGECDFMETAAIQEAHAWG